MPSSPTNPAGETTKIAFLTTELGVGGAERALVNLACGLDREEFDPVFYALSPPPETSRSQLVNRLENARIPVKFFGFSHSRHLFGAVRQVAKQLQQDQATVLQSFLFHGNVIGALAAKKCPGLKQVTGIRVADPRQWRHRLEKWAIKRCERIACVSQSVSQFCQHKARLPQEKIVVIPNGVDRELVKRRAVEAPADLGRFGIDPGNKTILYVGRLDIQKGVDWLLEWISTTFQQFEKTHLLLVGDGDLRPQLTAQVADHPFGHRIHFAGWQPNVHSIMAESTCLVLPSRWEGMPNALMEAMAVGIPVLASDVEGVREVLGDDGSDQWIKVGEEAEFNQKIAKILGNDSFAQGLGQANSRRIAEAFSVELMVQRYVELYRQIISAQPH